MRLGSAAMKAEENRRFDDDPGRVSTTLVRENWTGRLHDTCRASHGKSRSGNRQAASIQATTSNSISQSVPVEHIQQLGLEFVLGKDISREFRGQLPQLPRYVHGLGERDVQLATSPSDKRSERQAQRNL